VQLAIAGQKGSIILADRYLVNFAERFAPASSGETQYLPARPRIVGDNVTNSNLSHGHSSLSSFGRDLKTSHIFRISLRGNIGFLRRPRFP